MTFIKKNITFLVFILISVAASAQAAMFIDIDPDARSQAMGGISAAASASAFSFWNNSSAAVLSSDKWEAGVSYGMWKPSESNIISAGGYGRITRFMAVTAGVKYAGYPSISIYNEYGIEVSSASPKDISAGLGLAFRIVDGLALSANASYFSSDLGVSGAEKAGGVSFDFGATYHLKKMRFALTASNIGSKVDYGGTEGWNLPSNSKLGVGGTLGSDEHSVALDGQVGLLFSGSSFFASAGAEYTFHKMLSVRAGYHYGDDSKYIPSYASAGLGFRIKWFKIDGAYLIPFGDSLLRNTFMVNLSVVF